MGGVLGLALIGLVVMLFLRGTGPGGGSVVNRQSQTHTMYSGSGLQGGSMRPTSMGTIGQQVPHQAPPLAQNIRYPNQPQGYSGAPET